MFIGYSVFICSYFVTLEIMIRISYIATIICVTCVTCVFAKDFYDTKYDDVNVSEILANVKLREQYYKCFMNQGPCVTADAKFFRGIHIYIQIRHSFFSVTALFLFFSSFLFLQNFFINLNVFFSSNIRVLKNFYFYIYKLKTDFYINFKDFFF